jgi:hypothetical protein
LRSDYLARLVAARIGDELTVDELARIGAALTGAALTSTIAPQPEVNLLKERLDALEARLNAREKARAALELAELIAESPSGTGLKLQ